MRKVYKFSAFFFPAAVLSAVLIVAGIVAVCVRGVNFGIDFKPGMIEEVKIAPAVLEVSYGGSATISLDVSEAGMDVVVSGVGAENRTETFLYAQNPTAADVGARLRDIEGIAVEVKNPSVPSASLFVDSTVSKNLGSEPLRLFAPSSSPVSSDDVRNALSGYTNVDVKALGTDADRSFQIRMGLSDGEKGGQIQERTNSALVGAFGADNVAVVKSDFIGAQFSGSLIKNSIVLVLATLVLIFIYAAFRFKWDFALAAVVAIVHDSLIMVSFIAWSQMEFSTTTLAAILTIIGYSINATVVILDRIRSDIRVVEAKTFVDVLNAALTATLGRSVITTVTTLFAVVSLAVFTTGPVHDFAVALIVGLISGCYSSIFIAGAFISFVRRNDTFQTVAVAPNVRQFQPEA